MQRAEIITEVAVLNDRHADAHTCLTTPVLPPQGSAYVIPERKASSLSLMRLKDSCCIFNADKSNKF